MGAIIHIATTNAAKATYIIINFTKLEKRLIIPKCIATAPSYAP